jgi:hypothetical protein
MPNQSVDPSLASLIEQFTRQIVAVVENATAQRINAALASALGAPVKRGPGRPPKAAIVPTAAAALAASPKPAKKASPKTALARKLQGQYLGALNGLTAADKAKVKQVAASKGKAEAIKLAQSIKAEKK